MRRVYLDHSATTPTRGEVAEAMQPFFTQTFGNASSVHRYGREARKAVEDARDLVAGLLGATPKEIVFTSGGTESDNLAIKGAAYALREQGRHIITSAVEHHAVLNTCRTLEDEGWHVTRLPVDRHGLVSVDDLRKAVRADTTLATVMMANNEVGTLQPIAALARTLAEETDGRAVFHTDAVQAVGKVQVNVDELGLDMLSLSAHKFYGPKGVGALYIRSGTRFQPLQHGGHHEHGRRAGTENVPGIFGMAEALRLACEEMPNESQRLSSLRDRLQQGLLESIEDATVNGHPTQRLPHLVNISFRNVEGESMLLSLDAVGVALSTGSACTSGSLEPSHVLTAMGIAPEVAHGSLRFSLGRINTEEDVDYVFEKLPPIVERLREMSPFLTREFSA